MDGFTCINNSFLIDPRFTLAEKALLAWLASKPADWQVRPENIQKELGIGPDATKRILRNLRTKGAITKPEANRRGTDGQWVKPPSRLAIREEIRYISAGRTVGGKPPTVPTSTDTSLPRSDRGWFTGDGTPADTTKESKPKIDIETLTEEVEPATGEASAEPIVSPFEDQTLADLVRNAPDTKALEIMWGLYKDSQWTPELTELAKTRKAELASAEV